VMFSEMDDGAWKKVLGRACGTGARSGGAVCVPGFAGERMAIEQRVGAAFSGVTLATEREEMLAAIVQGLVAQCAGSYGMLSAIRKPAKLVYAMGGAGLLQDAMHRGWRGRHVFRALEGDSLRGLAELGRRALE